MSTPPPAASFPDETLSHILAMACERLSPFERQATIIAFRGVCRSWYVASFGREEYFLQKRGQVRGLTLRIERGCGTPINDVGVPPSPAPKSLSIILGEGISTIDKHRIELLIQASRGSLRELEIYHTPRFRDFMRRGDNLLRMEDEIVETHLHCFDRLCFKGERDPAAYLWRFIAPNGMPGYVKQVLKALPRFENHYVDARRSDAPTVRAVEISCLETGWSFDGLIILIEQYSGSLTSIEIGEHSDIAFPHLISVLHGISDRIPLSHFAYDRHPPPLPQMGDFPRNLCDLVKELLHVESLDLGTVLATDDKLFAALCSHPKLRKLTLTVQGAESYQIIENLTNKAQRLEHLEIRLPWADDEWPDASLRDVRDAAKRAGLRFWYHGRKGLEG